MQNIPRIYIDSELSVGAKITLSPDVAHYLTHVMRIGRQGNTKQGFIVFNNGIEFYAEIINVSPVSCIVSRETGRADPSNNLTLAFAPIKQSRLEEMINMAVQMGVARLCPVITERTDAHFINWNRIHKIMIEAAEQSGRNSIPELSAPVKFSDFIANNKNIIFADERFAHSPEKSGAILEQADPTELTIFIGPEGGFSSSEFDALDKSSARGISLGRTILRAETAAVVAIGKLL